MSGYSQKQRSDIINLEGSLLFNNGLINSVTYHFRDTDYVLTEAHDEESEGHDEHDEHDEHDDMTMTDMTNMKLMAIIMPTAAQQSLLMMPKSSGLSLIFRMII